MRIGWIGLGKLGLQMARRVHEAGFALQVFDLVQPAQDIKGAIFARGIEELAESSDIVFTSLPDDHALDSVASAVFPYMRQGTVLVDTSTVSPQICDSIRRSAGPVGYVAAPISGSTEAAALGTLTAFCSGSAASIAQARPVLGSFANRVFEVGWASEARYLKLAINHFIGTTPQIAAEALTLARAGGVEWSVLLDVLEQSAAASPFLKYKIAVLRRRDFSPAFTIDQMLKDMLLIMQAGASIGLELNLAERVTESYRRQSEEGLADLDLIATLLSMEKVVGLGEP